MKRQTDISRSWWLLLVFVLAGLLTLLKPAPESVKLPTTEQVGKSIGKQSVRFTKGFVEGVKDQISSRD